VQKHTCFPRKDGAANGNPSMDVRLADVRLGSPHSFPDPIGSSAGAFLLPIGSDWIGWRGRRPRPISPFKKTSWGRNPGGESPLSSGCTCEFQLGCTKKTRVSCSASLWWSQAGGKSRWLCGVQEIPSQGTEGRSVILAQRCTEQARTQADTTMTYG